MPDSLPPEDEIARLRVENAALRAERDFVEQHNRDLQRGYDDLDVKERAALSRLSALQERAERAEEAAAILLPFVDMAAGEGLEWSEQECGSPRMDAADLCVQAAEALGFELGDDRYAALLKQGEDAIRAASKSLTPESQEKAEALSQDEIREGLPERAQHTSPTPDSGVV